MCREKTGGISCRVGLGRVASVCVLGLFMLLGPRPAAGSPVIGYVYTNDSAFPNAVSAYAVGVDGSLSELPGSPFLTGGNGNGGFFAADRSGIGVNAGSQRLYVTDNASATISAFNIAGNGTLTAIAGSPFGTGLMDPESLAINSAGTCLFVADGVGSSGGIVPIPINADGSLGMPLATVSTGGSEVDDLQLTGAGAYLAASLPHTSSLAVFAVSASCGLTPLSGSPFTVPGELAGLRFNKAGTRLFGGIATSGNTEVAVFSVPFAFTQISGSPFTFAAGHNSNVVLLNPAETKLFVSNQDSDTITVLDVATDGALSLSPIAGNPFFAPGADFPAGMAMDPGGTVLLVANGNGVNSFTAAADGTLTPAPGSPVFVNNGIPFSLVFIAGGQAQGTQCGNGTDCGTGFCADGVCCDSACGGGASTDCQACSVAAGAPSDGTCAPLTGTTCDDGNVCTTDVCSSGACVGTPVADDTGCDDHNDCTQDDVCTAGHCGGTNVMDDTPCDDGDLCTQTDTCQGGHCTGTDPVICPAPDQCHDVPACDPSTGTCSNPLLPDYTSCDDGDVCTQDDVCTAGHCGGTNVIDDTPCDDGNLCTQDDVCTAGHCGGTDVIDDTPCDDGDLCTQTDTCQGGHCTGTDPVICPTPDQCHDVPACDPSTGTCSNPLLPDYTSCDDGDVCTIDYCLGGICSPLNPRAANLYVDVAGSDAGNDCTNGLSPCATIQHGVDAACKYDAVNVAAGTYQENVVVSQQQVNIQGAGQDVTVVEPAVSNPDCGGTGGGDPLCGGASSVFLVQADNVTIQRLTVEGDNPGLTSGVVRGGADVDARNGIISTDLVGGLSVYSVTVKDVYLRGIQSSGSSSTGVYYFYYNLLTNITGDDEFSIALNHIGYGDYAYMFYNTISYASKCVSSSHSLLDYIYFNSVNHCGIGIQSDSAGEVGGSQGLLSFNDVRDCVATTAIPSNAGIVVSMPYIAPFVSYNTVSNCVVGLAQHGQGHSFQTAFLGNTIDGGSVAGSICALVSTDMFDLGSADVTANFYLNDLHDCETGLAVQQQSGYNALVYAQQNTFESNNQTGVDVGAGAANLACNLITGNATGVGASTATVGAHQNVIVGNGLGADGRFIGAGSMSATENWWGCVGGPGSAGCDGVAGNVDVAPPLNAAPACVYCNSAADCDDGLACNGAEVCNGTCGAGTPPPACSLPSGVDARCNAPTCIEPTGACGVQPYPDGTPCNNGDGCQHGVCTGPNSLKVETVRLRHSDSAMHGNGLAAVRAMLDDNSTGGTLHANLMAGAVTLDIYDGGSFRTRIPLTGCKASATTISCRNVAVHARASFRQLGRHLPNVYAVRISQRKLDRTHTGSGTPTGPVGVVIHENLVDRGASLAASHCRPANGSLLCNAS